MVHVQVLPLRACKHGVGRAETVASDPWVPFGLLLLRFGAYFYSERTTGPFLPPALEGREENWTFGQCQILTSKNR